MASSLHSRLGMDDYCSDLGHQLRAFPFEIQEPTIHAANGESGARDPFDPGSIQEIFDERSSQAADERRSDGHLPARGSKSGGRLPADVAAVADLVGAVARAERRN